MKKVITYGTYDLLHCGHIKLLERAKALGDYLVVGVTADSFDKSRGKINVYESLNERMESVRKLGIADEIIVEDYEGQKIDDIRRLGIDIFTVGSDWAGKFDYLKEYCDVVYLDRTQGVSSTEIRSSQAPLRLGFVGGSKVVAKYIKECSFVNGITPLGVWFDGEKPALGAVFPTEFNSLDSLFDAVDAVYICSHPSHHYNQIKQALLQGKHVLCESPIAEKEKEVVELQAMAKSKNVVLADAIKTAYSTAFHRMLLLVKSGRIGRVVSVDATCTSMADYLGVEEGSLDKWTASMEWAPIALLPALQILGSDYADSRMLKWPLLDDEKFDAYGEIELLYPNAIAHASFGKYAKSEGSLIVSGTDGYVYVPAPWWKTDYFEIRKEDQTLNRRYFYQLDGEGIRYELVSFARAVQRGDSFGLAVDSKSSRSIAGLLERFADNSMCYLMGPIRANSLTFGEGVKE